MLSRKLLFFRVLYRFAYIPHFQGLHTRDFFQDQPSIKQCRNVKDILRIVTNPKYQKTYEELQIIETCKRIQELNGTIGSVDSKFTFLIDIINTLNFQTCSLQLIESVCNTIPIFNINFGFQFKIYLKMKQRIQKVLQSKQSLSIRKLISFLYLLQQTKSIKTLQSVFQLLLQRCKQFKQKDMVQYLRFLKTRPLGLKLERQIVSKILTMLQNQLQFMSIINKIQIYIALKEVNRIYYNTGLIEDKIEQEILQRIQSLDQKEINQIFKYKSQFNPFYRIIFIKVCNKVMSMGYNNFEDPLPILKLIAEISQLHNLNMIVSNQKKQALIQFLVSHAGKFKDFLIQIISNSFFSNSQLTQFHKIIVSNNQKYLLESLRYAYEITSRNIQIGEQFKPLFIKCLNKPIPLENMIAFFRFSLTVKKIRFSTSFNQEYSPEYKQIINKLYNFIQAQINKLKQDTSSLRQINNFSKYNNVFYEFCSSFYHIFVDQLQRSLLTQNNSFENYLFYFLLYAKKYEEIKRVLINIPGSLSKYQLRKLIQRGTKIPKLYKNSWDKIIKIILLTIESQKVDIIKIMNLLVNKQFQSSLSLTSTNNMLKLATICIKKWNFKYGPLDSFVSSIVFSENNFVKSNKHTRQLLFEYQKVNSQFHLKNNRSLHRYLCSTNLMLPSTARVIIEKNYSQKDTFIHNYCKSLIGQKLRWQQQNCIKNNIPIFLKSDPLKNQQEEAKMNAKKILNSIKEYNNSNQIQSLLLNFQMNINESSLQILEALFIKYRNFIASNHFKFKVFSIQHILYHFQRYDLRSSSQFKKFLEQAGTHIMKNRNKYQISCFAKLAEYYLSYNMQCKSLATFIGDYISKKNLIPKLYEEQYYKLLNILAIFQTENSSKVFEMLTKITNRQIKKRVFFLMDLSNRQVKEKLNDFLVNSRKRKFIQGQVNYLDIKYREELTNLCIKRMKMTNCIVSSQLHQNLIVFFRQFMSLNWVEISKSGERFIKINENYIVAINEPYSQVLNKKYQQYYSCLLNVQSQKVILINAHQSQISYKQNLKRLNKQFSFIKLNQQRVKQFLMLQLPLKVKQNQQKLTQIQEQMTFDQYQKQTIEFDEKQQVEIKGEKNYEFE